MQNVMVTGGAGFIGSHLCDALIEEGKRVICVDNLWRGDRNNIGHLMGHKNFVFFERDVRDQDAMEELLADFSIEMVYHLAANTDLWQSMTKPQIEHECTFDTTRVLLDAMKNQGVKNLFFASTSVIYGEQADTKGFSEEDMLLPISYYGAAKMASEAYIRAFAYMNDMNVLIYRFSNIVGSRMTHGVIRDFAERLLEDPTHLDVRGNGYQTKPYLHVSEVVRAMMMHSLIEKGVNIYNVGATTQTNVRFIAGAVLNELGLVNIPIHYEEKSSGWKGDVARYEYNVEKIRSKGWFAQMNSNETIICAVKEIVAECRKRNGERDDRI